MVRNCGGQLRCHFNHRAVRDTSITHQQLFPHIFGVHPQGDRSVIEQVNLHIRAELAGLDRQAALAAARDECFIQRDGGLRTGSAREARAVALAAVTVERELRHDEQTAADIRE